MDKTEETTNQILKDLEKNDKLKRKHANFYEFHKKSVKETGIFTEFMSELKKVLSSPIKSWELTANDPPDISLELEDGTNLGVELTELVNEKAIHTQINNPAEYAAACMSYGVKEASEDIRLILKKKEKKLQKIAQHYNQLILLIHTDETMFNSDSFINTYKNILVSKSDIFSHVYLIFSYEPAKQKCPILKLQ